MRSLCRHLRAVPVALLALLHLVSPVFAGERVLVAVAANFAGTLAALAPGFEAATGHRIDMASGATGGLYAQIVNGAPFAVLLAADQARPERLVAEGHAVAGSRFTYAVGRLALWSASEDRITGEGPAVLTSPMPRHLAIANPELAPYGAAAREALTALGLWQALAPRIVMGQNAGQTLSMVATGNAELGLVPLSMLDAGAGSRWDVPPELHAPIRQDAVLLTAGADSPAASAFLAYLASPPARDLIAGHGYGVE